MGINQTPPPVIIEKVVVNGRNYPVDRELVIPPGKNNIEIRYTALSFIAPEKIQFKYRMEEYDDHWIEASTARTVHYAALSPGHYRFRVIACNSDGVWNEAGAMLAISLRPKYYETLLFKIAIFILLPVFILAAYFFIYRRLDQAQFQGKARTLNMNPEETEKCIHKLLYLFNEEKIFKDADITLKSLSSRLLVSPRLLSQIINDRLKVNFHDLINQYRIKEAQRILTDPRSGDKSILDIAYEVGFNSKSAFNRIFKKHANLTPSWYRRRCQESKSAKA
jgi:AraC-like DNA-binding protein